MKNLISYVIQDENGHKHLSEILEIESPPYSFSSDPTMSEVIKWAEKKKLELKNNQALVIVNVFKL